MPFRARVFSFTAALIVSLLALPAAGIAAGAAARIAAGPVADTTSTGAAPDDPAVLLKNAVPRDLIPANYRNEGPLSRSGSGSLQSALIRFNGPDQAGIEFELTSYSDLTQPILKVYDLETRYLPDAEILARDLGIGDASFHSQRRAPELAPFDIRSQTVRAYWGTYRLEVAVRDYHPVGRSPHFSHAQAAELAKRLAGATIANMSGAEGGETAGGETDRVAADAPDEQGPPRTLTQAEWEKRREELAEMAPFADNAKQGELWKEGIIGVLVGISGDVEVYDYSGRPRQGAKDGFIRIGDVVRTGKDGLARIQFCDRNERLNAGPSLINIAVDSDMVFDKFEVGHEDSRRQDRSIFTLIKGAVWDFFEGWGKNSAVSIRTGVTICGIRGSEVFISYDPRADRVNAYVIEGHMDVTNTATGATQTLTNNQRLAVTNGAIGSVQPMSQAEWDSLMKRQGMDKLEPSVSKPAKPVKPVPPVPPVPAAAYAIPELGADVTDIKFYESNFSGSPQEERVYRKLFARNATRSINWEVRLKYPAPGRRVEFDIDAVWTATGIEGSLRQTLHASVEADWTGSNHNFGRGWPDPGHWNPGTYTIDFFHKGRKIAIGSFKVYE